MPKPDGTPFKAEILSVREVNSPLTARMGQLDKEVQYRIDGMGPFVLYIPLEDYSLKVVQEKVQARLKEWAEVVGKTFEVK